MVQETPQDVEREFRKIWDTLELADTIAVKLHETIVPPRLSLDNLPSLLPRLTEGQLEMGDTIGRGGMSRVQVATQVALQREVAVKVLKDTSELKAKEELLAEAWVIGALEHPNIVPIHLLGEDDRGSPMLVMKRISGHSWRDVLHHPERHAGILRGEDPLLWHLGVLMQVCNAVHFAHSRGIVHRDLKPENVMVGGFGEVYVLDWGLAVSVNESPSRFRLARDIDAVAGTPGYMAPEMVDYQNRPITTRTDVYLLGSILYEILTGRPRHQGNSLAEVLFTVYLSRPPDLPSDVPPELAAIVRRATATAPNDRFESADAFKQALQKFLHHRASSALVREASRSLEVLRREASASGTDSGGRASEVQRAYAEARFGYQQALHIWRDDPEALAGLRETAVLMADHEIRRGAFASAQAIISSLDPPDADLLSRLDALGKRLERQKQELVQLKQLKRDTNVDIGASSRSWFALAIGIAWGVVPILAGILRRAEVVRIGYPLIIQQTAAFGTTVLALMWLGRRSLLTTEINRKIMSTLLLLVAALLVHRTASYVLALPIDTSLVIEIFIFFLVVSFFAVALDVRVGWTSPVYLIAFFAAAFFPQWIFEITGCANLVTMSIFAWVTRSSRATE